MRNKFVLLFSRRLVKCWRPGCKKVARHILGNALFNKSEGQPNQVWQEIGPFYNVMPFCYWNLTKLKLGGLKSFDQSDEET